MIPETIKISEIVKTLNNNPSYIVYIILAIMLVFCVLELASFKKNTFKDYKSLIISVGILGTFVGIFLGLWNFDTKDITGSVPKLLEGLKLAFATSVLGMFFAIVLAVIENFIKKDSTDTTDLLRNILLEQREINKKLGANTQPKILEKILLEQREINKKLGANTQPKILEKILLEQQQANEKSNQIIQIINNSKENINNHFKTVTTSLNKALEHLSKGATQEIINALQLVISDFNKNLTEQFGENFKQLNESIKNMIKWQENYKTAIEQIEMTLNKATLSIEKTANYTEQFTTHYEKISTISTDLQTILEVNHNQVRNMETGLSSLEKIGKEAELITASLNDFSGEIQKSLSEQSTALNRLNKELNTELKKSLENLNKVLTSLTNKFRQEYESYLDHFKKLLEEFYQKKQ